MNCKHSTELLLEYTDGTLDEAARVDFEHHMERCAGCRILLATYRKTTTLCKKALHAAVPHDVEERVLSFLRKRLSSKAE